MSSDAYVPVYHEKSDAWYPSNRAGDLLVHLRHIWSDIASVNDVRLRERDSNPIVDRLLFKYILVEFISLTSPLRELLGIAMKAPRLIRGRPAPPRYVTRRDVEEIGRLNHEFRQKLNPVQDIIAKIRNKLGAHRELSTLEAARMLWEKVDASTYIDVVNSFLPLFDRLSELNIYEWSRVLGSGACSIFGCRIMHPWDDAFEDDEKS